MDKRPKQVIVVDKSLQMPSGKLAAQVAHASIGALLSTSVIKNGVCMIPALVESAQGIWLSELFTKVVVYVKSTDKLIKVHEQAKQKGLPCILIKDVGLTFFEKPTYTCVGIGPCWDEDFVGITDRLRLLE